MICKLSSKPEDQCTNPDYLDCKHCDYGFDIQDLSNGGCSYRTERRNAFIYRFEYC